MTRVRVVFEGQVPAVRRIRDRLAVKLVFSGRRNAARHLLRLTGVKSMDRRQL